MDHQSGADSEDGGDNRANRLRLVFVPLPSMGHLVAMVEFAKHLLHFHSDADHRLDITFLNIQLPEPRPEVSSYIASSGTGIAFVDLPAVGKMPGTSRKTAEAAITDFVELHTPLVRSAVRDMFASGLVLDFFCSTMIDVANELGIPSYVFFTSSAAFLGMMLHAPKIVSDLPAVEDEVNGFLSSQFLGKTIDLPGFTAPFPVSSMPLPLSNPKDDAFEAFAIHARRFVQSKGILINTFYELEPNPMKDLEEGLYLPRSDKHGMPPVYAVGPILSLDPKISKSTATSSEPHECIQWLDQQSPGSVVYLCFGSMGAFSAAQAREIAVGLEESGQRFLWVLRSQPSHSQQHQGRSQVPKDADLKELLPDGFLEKTKARGLVWPSFAPQKEILSHASIGGFVTHCGWNSCLESLWFGVPMAAWPLYAEQHCNAFEMVAEMGVALEIHIDREAGNAATAEEVKRVVTALMGHESAQLRKKAQLMKDVARSVFHKGGSSFHAIQGFVQNLPAAATNDKMFSIR